MTHDRRPAVKFQHLELTFAKGALTKDFCTQVDSFWCDVFGWRSDDVEYPDLDDMFQHRLHADGQTIVLTESPEPMSLPVTPVGMGPGETVAVPHLGLLLDTLEDLESLLDATRQFQATDSRVKIWDAGENRFPGHRGLHHGFLTAYLLPIWFDVFATRWDAGAEPTQSWQYVDHGVSE
jgi:hypothetical protein